MILHYDLFSVDLDEAIKTCTNILFQLSCDGTQRVHVEVTLIVRQEHVT